MNTNKRYNQAAIKQFRKDLSSMLDDITEIDKKVLNRAVNEGVKVAKENTNVVTGFMKKSWQTTPSVKKKAGEVSKTLFNSADYAPYVNYGHRIVNGNKETIGFVKGQFMLEKAIGRVNKALVREFRKEVERVSKKHDK